MKFAQDLYPSSSPSVPSNISPTSSPTSSFLPSFDFFNNLDLTEIIVSFNRYVLIWTIFVSVMYVANFWFYYRKQGDSEIAREATGQKSLWLAAKIWWRYLPSLILFVIFGFTSGIWKSLSGILMILALTIKIGLDVYTFLGITDYFDWYNGFSKGFRSILSLEFARVKKKK